MAQKYRSVNDSEKYQILLWCPLKHLCSCTVDHKLFYTKDKVVLKAFGKHTLTSHIQDSSKQNLQINFRAQSYAQDICQVRAHCHRLGACAQYV